MNITRALKSETFSYYLALFGANQSWYLSLLYGIFVNYKGKCYISFRTCMNFVLQDITWILHLYFWPRLESYTTRSFRSPFQHPWSFYNWPQGTQILTFDKNQKNNVPYILFTSKFNYNDLDLLYLTLKDNRNQYFYSTIIETS